MYYAVQIEKNIFIEMITYLDLDPISLFVLQLTVEDSDIVCFSKTSNNGSFVVVLSLGLVIFGSTPFPFVSFTSFFLNFKLLNI